MKKILFLLFMPLFLPAQTKTGFTFTRESGIIYVRTKDTITTASGNEYKTEEMTFPDSSSAADFMELRKTALLEQATRWAEKARADSTAWRRLTAIGTDSGLFPIPESVVPPEKIPELITVPEQPKKKATKPKKKKEL